MTVHSRLRSRLIAIAAVTLLTAATGVAIDLATHHNASPTVAPTAAVSVLLKTPIHIAGAGAKGVALRAAPDTTQPEIIRIPDGATPDYKCFTYGQVITGHPIWFYVTFQGKTGFYASHYDDAHYSSDADLTARYGVPLCTTLANSIDQSMHITLNSSAGQHEKLVAAISPQIAEAAHTAGVDGQTLARVIYHEGGNYFSPRRSATEIKEALVSGSVGIGQLKPDTVKLVAIKVYHDYVLAQEDSAVIREKLVYDWDFSLKYAAGYIRLLQDAGVSGDWPLFMAYSLSVDQAVKWKAAGHPMDPASLARIGFVDSNQDNFLDFRTRQQLFNDAKNAIG